MVNTSRESVDSIFDRQQTEYQHIQNQCLSIIRALIAIISITLIFAGNFSSVLLAPSGAELVFDPSKIETPYDSMIAFGLFGIASFGVPVAALIISSLISLFLPLTENSLSPALGEAESIHIRDEVSRTDRHDLIERNNQTLSRMRAHFQFGQRLLALSVVIVLFGVVQTLAINYEVFDIVVLFASIIVIGYLGITLIGIFTLVQVTLEALRLGYNRELSVSMIIPESLPKRSDFKLRRLREELREESIPFIRTISGLTLIGTLYYSAASFLIVIIIWLDIQSII